jgi:hypothetical protein
MAEMTIRRFGIFSVAKMQCLLMFRSHFLDDESFLHRHELEFHSACEL